MTKAQGLWNRLFETSRELGFGAVGAVSAHPDPKRPVLEAWLDAGMHGDMAWMAKDPARRTDPRRHPWLSGRFHPGGDRHP